MEFSCEEYGGGKGRGIDRVSILDDRGFLNHSVPVSQLGRPIVKLDLHSHRSNRLHEMWLIGQ